jgi:FkbM family methyltransferase
MICFKSSVSRRKSLTRLVQKLIVSIVSALSKSFKNSYTPEVIYSADTVGNTVNITGGYEQDQLLDILLFLETFVPQIYSGNAIDCGANIGTHSIVLANYFRQVYSFEPNPLTYSILSLNTQRLPNVSRYNSALSDSYQMIDLNINESNRGGTQIIESIDGEIVAMPLDSFKFENISLIKLDIEGHEFNALLGAKKLIQHQRPVILIEQRAIDFCPSNKEPVSISLLRGLDYSIFIRFDPALNSGSVAKRLGWMIIGLLLPYQTKIFETPHVRPADYEMIVCIPSCHLQPGCQ